ncbi:MAG: hypothetical protein KKG01_01400, partial [Candidatus Omnitrophica bacterium]|nr:hypothetical protein [Candidatus Omnitrophota bacterium]
DFEEDIDTVLDTTLDPEDIIIPDQYGTVIETHRGTNGKLIIHIQDAHCNYEGQMNEAYILEVLMEDYDLNLVLSESKLTDRDFKYIRPWLTADKRKEVADNLVKDGYITGVDYVDLSTDYPFVNQGIEDKELYDSNRDALWELDKYKVVAGEYIDEMIIAANTVKPSIYTDDLLELDSKKKAYDTEEIDLLEYYEYLYKTAENNEIPLYTFPNFQNLIKASELEKKIDLTKVRDGSATDEEMDLYSEYLEATRDLNINELFKEEPLLEDVVQDTLAVNYDQRKLLRVSKALSIVRNLLKIKIVPEEYRHFMDNEKDFDPMFWSAFLKEKSSELNFSLDIPNNYQIINDTLPKVKNFYKLAADREKVFLSRTQKQMTDRGVDFAALIAGGFHTPTLTDLLADAGYSYIVVSPKVTTETDEELYRWALKMDWIPELKGGEI